MKTAKRFPNLGAVIILAVLISQVSAVPSLEIFRFRREADSSPEPEPEAATTMMSSASSPISVTVSSSSGLGDEINPSEEDSSTIMPESSTGKGIGGKMKDAMNSAEGWIKNAGQNIKQGLDKAKESIKHTASDIKEKVKKGMDSVSNQRRTGSSRSKNGTSGNDADCEAKDGKCSTDMPNDSTSSPESNSDESNQSPMPPTTNAPGYKKMRRRRHTYGTNRYNYAYPSSGIYSGNTMQYGARPYGSDSNEYSWSSRTTGNRDVNRRYKRSQTTEASSGANNATESMATSGSSNQKNGERRQKRDYDGNRTTSTRSHQTSISTSSTSSDDSRENNSGERRNYNNGRVTRDANNRKMEESMHSSNMTASSTEAMSTSAAEEDSAEQQQNNHNGNSATTNSSFSVSVHVVTPSQQSQIQPIKNNYNGNYGKLREGRGPIYFSDESNEQNTQLEQPPIQFPDGSYGQHGKHPNYQNHQNLPNYDNNKKGGRYTRGFNGYSQMGDHYNPNYTPEDYGQYTPILDPDTMEMTTGSWGLPHMMGGGLDWTSTMGPSYDNDQGYHHHYTQNGYQSGGNGGGGNEGVLESGSLDMGNMPEEQYGGNYGGNYHLNNQSSAGGINRPSHNFYNGQHHHHRNKNKHNKHAHEQENTDYYSHGVMSSGNEADKKPHEQGACRPIASAKKCNMLRDDSAQCLYDTDCSGNSNKTEGTKKCCFYHCDPYKIVGICEHVSYTVTSSS